MTMRAPALVVLYFILNRSEKTCNMILLGTSVNALLIIIGSIIGRFFKKIPEKMKTDSIINNWISCGGTWNSNGL